jgi:hypothetical protein
MSDSAPYNPLDKKNLGASVAEALLGRKVHPMDGIKTFQGAGIYALYYTGSFSAYNRIAGLNAASEFVAPISERLFPQARGKAVSGWIRKPPKRSTTACRNMQKVSKLVRTSRLQIFNVGSWSLTTFGFHSASPC